MTDDHEYYHTPDHGHDKSREWPDSIMYCVLACVGLFSWLCIYLVRAL